MSEQPSPVANTSAPIIDRVMADLRIHVGDERDEPFYDDSDREGVSVRGLVGVDLLDRAELGRQRYGVYLQAGNGRDALRDAYEEALDLVMYLRQAIEESTERSCAPWRIYDEALRLACTIRRRISARGDSR